MKKYTFLLAFLLLSLASTTYAADTTTNIAAINDVKTNHIEHLYASGTNSIDTIVNEYSEYINSFTEKMATHAPKWMQQEIVAIPLWQIVFLFAMLLLGYIGKKFSDFFFQHKILASLHNFRLSWLHSILDCTSKPCGTFVFSIFAATAMVVLFYGSPFWQLTKVILHLGYGTLILWWFYRFVNLLTAKFVEYAKKTETELDDQLSLLLKKAMRVTIFVIYGLWIIKVLGYSISAFIAGLGIGGIAVALALQDTLANLFGSIFILLDHPFRVGDRIVVDGVDGIVEELGFRCTRIRTLEKTLVSIPNKTVAMEKIDNITSRKNIKVKQTIGLTYDTSAEDMEKAADKIEALLIASPEVCDSPIIVGFTEFDNSSLNISIIYFAHSTDYQEYIKIKQRTNLKIMRTVQDLGLDFAFPSQTIYIAKDNDNPSF